MLIFVLQPSPANAYPDAVARIRALQADERPATHPLGRTRLLSHGRQVERTAVLLHGLTASPEQFAPLGEALYQRGYNVYIPRYPHHGLVDRMTTEIGDLTAAKLVDCAARAVDLATGLGRHVTVVGFSLGGTLAAWLAQHRAEVDRAIPIEPYLGLRGLSPTACRALAAAALRLPNRFLWWDPRYRERYGTEWGYPRVCTHALAEGLRLADAIAAAACVDGPAARSVLVITNRHDPSLNHRTIERLVWRWLRRAPDRISTFELRGLPRLHDFISLERNGRAGDGIVPPLVDLIAEDYGP